MSSKNADKDELYAGSELIGYLYPDDPEINPTFYFFYRFEPTYRYERYRALFESKSEMGKKLLRGLIDPLFRRKQKKIDREIDNLDLRLRFSDGRTFKLTAINIGGDRAAWRTEFLRPEEVRRWW